MFPEVPTMQSLLDTSRYSLLKYLLALASVAQSVGVLSCKLKGCLFDS